MRYSPGDKIIVLDKTMPLPKEQSNVYKKCIKQGFGYVDSDNGDYLQISAIKGEITGSFNYRDVKPYVNTDEYPTHHSALSAYIRGEVDECEYVELKKYFDRSGEDASNSKKFKSSKSTN